MNYTEMSELLDNEVPAIDIAIKKWEDILKDKGKDFSDENCALCELYYCTDRNTMPEEEYEHFLEREDTCPINKYTGRGHCYGTPYYNFEYHYDNCEKCSHTTDVIKYCDKAKELAKDELDFLKKIKREIENGKL